MKFLNQTDKVKPEYFIYIFLVISNLYFLNQGLRVEINPIAGVYFGVSLFVANWIYYRNKVLEVNHYLFQVEKELEEKLERTFENEIKTPVKLTDRNHKPQFYSRFDKRKQKEPDLETIVSNYQRYKLEQEKSSINIKYKVFEKNRALKNRIFLLSIAIILYSSYMAFTTYN